MSKEFNYTPECFEAFEKIKNREIHTLYMRYIPGRNELYVDKTMTPQPCNDIVNTVKDNYLNNACIIISSQHRRFQVPQSIFILWTPDSAPFPEKVPISAGFLNEKFKCVENRSYNVLSDFDELK